MNSAAAQGQKERIHLLGLGSIGLLVAHSLKSIHPSPPPVTLLLHRQSLIEDLTRHEGSVRILNKKTGVVDRRSGFDVEVVDADSKGGKPRWRMVDKDTSSSVDGPITSLVVACKGPATVSAIRNVRHRINGQSTICLLQNGMGQVDQLNSDLFSDPDTRPAYMLGIMSHGLYLQDTFTAVHAGQGTIALGVVRDLTTSSNSKEDMKPSSEYLFQTLLKAPSLGCASFEYSELVQLQLEKLLVNCILNPLTALLDVRNGQTLGNAPLTELQRSMIAEISEVIQKLPELKDSPGVSTRFSPEKLMDRLVHVTQITAENSSSMREDVRNSKDTEIDYINDYIIRRGRELGVKCAANEVVVQLIRAKTQASRASK